MKELFSGYFVILWDGVPLGLDDASGGYPWKPSYPAGVKYWTSSASAHEYIRTFQKCDSQKMYADMVLKPVTIGINEGN